MGVDIDAEQFDLLVDRALAEIPAELAAQVQNCLIIVEDEAPDDDPDLLGLYDGIPLSERDSSYIGDVPDVIYLFHGPILDMCATVDDVVREVRITVIHEVGHYFGIDDERLHDLGWA